MKRFKFTAQDSLLLSLLSLQLFSLGCSVDKDYQDAPMTQVMTQALAQSQAQSQADAKNPNSSRDENSGNTTPSIEQIDSVSSISESDSVSDSESAALKKHNQGIYKAAVWHGKQNSEAWTDAVMKVVRERIGDFEQAKDIEDFCPSYFRATTTQKEICWLRLISSVAKVESSFKPATMYMEQNGVYSVGLLQLSERECKHAPTNSLLKNPVLNLACGANIMAKLIRADGYIDGPKSDRGAAAYWSTLRTKYRSGHLRLGKKAIIMNHTQEFQQF